LPGFFPCGQAERRGKGGIDQMLRDIVIAFKPKVFVMENVGRIIKSKAWETAKKTFKAGGYGLTEIILDASYCGVPQIRKSFFCVGFLGKDDFLLLPYFENKLASKQMTTRDYFGETLRINYYYRHPRNYSRRAIFSVDEPSPTIRGVNRPVPQGYHGHPNDPVKISDAIQLLTTLERLQIQTFPENFIRKGTQTDVEQMIGNAVPVNLAKFVANAIINYCAAESERDWS
jgi:DNA (cytosine-5)-methyltransferase 1